MNDLPQCMYFKGKSYYLVKNNTWHNLGRDRAVALQRYSDINDGVELSLPTSSQEPQMVKYCNFPIPIEKVIDAAVSKPASGIYFLLKGDDVVYVGQSKNIMQRIGKHAFDMSGCFDRYFYLECDHSKLDEWEGNYIRQIKPKHNRKIPQS